MNLVLFPKYTSPIYLAVWYRHAYGGKVISSCVCHAQVRQQKLEFEYHIRKQQAAVATTSSYQESLQVIPLHLLNPCIFLLAGASLAYTYSLRALAAQGCAA